MSIEGAYEADSKTERFKNKCRRIKKRLKSIQEKIDDKIDDKIEEYGLDSGSESEDDEEKEMLKSNMSLASISSSVYEIEQPCLSTSEYYWQGKDYSNCYMEDFKELEFFAKGDCWKLIMKMLY